jgi:hypothetical protein
MAGNSILLTVICLLLSLTACERRTEARLEGGNPPVFSIGAGTGNVWFISIGEYEMDKSLNTTRSWHELWRVEPGKDKSGQPSGKPTWSIGKVTYGVAPEGYAQFVPAKGLPPTLSPDKYYSYEIKTDNGMPASGDFVILDGIAVKAKINHTCISDDGKEKVEAPCSEDND